MVGWGGGGRAIYLLILTIWGYNIGGGQEGMWTQFLKESRSQHKFHNKNLIVLGAKHSGKRSLMDSLFDISKTTLTKRGPASEGNRMRMKGVTTAIDYAYLNVTDTTDPDNRTHSKLEIYMVQEIDHPSVYSQLANTAFLRNSVFVVMLDFTAPWNFVAQVERWVKFIYELQRMAQVSIKELEEMGKEVEDFYKGYKEPQLDENGKLKITFTFDRDANEEALPLPEGVLVQNIRIPLVICVNKCDLQSQVLREQSNTKILVILYHLRSLAIKYGASLVYTSIRNNCNLNVLYEYVLHRAYRMPLRFKPEIANQEAIFIPLGFDNPTLIKDSVVKIDVERGFNDVLVAPISKKQAKEEILVEEDSKFFEKYINKAQSSTTNTENTASEREVERPAQRKKEEVNVFFLNLLQGGSTKCETTIKSSADQSQRLFNAEKDLLKHTAQVLEKRNLQK